MPPESPSTNMLMQSSAKEKGSSQKEILFMRGKAMAGDEDVVSVRLLEHLQAGIHQFGAHHHQEESADDAGQDREHQIHGADILVVGRIDVTAPACGMMAVIFGMMLFAVLLESEIGHGSNSYFAAR